VPAVGGRAGRVLGVLDRVSRRTNHELVELLGYVERSVSRRLLIPLETRRSQKNCDLAAGAARVVHRS